MQASAALVLEAAIATTPFHRRAVPVYGCAREPNTEPALRALGAKGPDRVRENPPRADERRESVRPGKQVAGLLRAVCR